MSRYVINKYYSFGSTCDGPRPTSGPGAGVLCRLSRKSVMEMGEYFLVEGTNVVDFENNWDLKEAIDLSLVEEIAQSRFEEWKEEREEWLKEHEGQTVEDDDHYSEEMDVDDFIDGAWEAVGDYYAEWDDELIRDTIEYYRTHKTVKFPVRFAVVPSDGEPAEWHNIIYKADGEEFGSIYCKVRFDLKGSESYLLGERELAGIKLGKDYHSLSDKIRSAVVNEAKNLGIEEAASLKFELVLLKKLFSDNLVYMR